MSNVEHKHGKLTSEVLVKSEAGEWRCDCRRVLSNTRKDNTRECTVPAAVSHAVTNTDALQLAETDHDDDNVDDAQDPSTSSFPH